MKDMLEEGELELCAVLQQKKKYRGWEQQPFYYDWNSVEGPYRQLCYLGQEEDSLDRLLGSTPSPKNEMKMHYGTKILRTSPHLQIHATLIPPL